jgi:hypothetical protein
METRLFPLEDNNIKTEKEWKQDCFHYKIKLSKLKKNGNKIVSILTI